MTDLPNSAADRAANFTTPDGEPPAGDPELAALVRRDAAPDVGDETAQASDAVDGAPAPEAVAEATEPGVELGVDAVPTLPLVAAVTYGEPPAPPRRRRSLALRFGVSFVLGVLLAVGIGAGALYAWGLQYDGRVLPGVRVGSTDLGGLTRDQAEAAIASAYGVARQRADHAHRPGRPGDHRLRRRWPRA